MRGDQGQEKQPSVAAGLPILSPTSRTCHDVTMERHPIASPDFTIYASHMSFKSIYFQTPKIIIAGLGNDSH